MTITALSVACLQVLSLASAQVPATLSFYNAANEGAAPVATVPLLSGGSAGAVTDVAIDLTQLPSLSAEVDFPDGGTSNVVGVDFRVVSGGAITCPTDECSGFYLYGADYCRREGVAPYALYGDSGGVLIAPRDGCALPAATPLTLRVVVERSQGLSPRFAPYSAKVKFVAGTGPVPSPVPAPVEAPVEAPVRAPVPAPVASPPASGGSCPQAATMRAVNGNFAVQFESFANRDQYCDADGNNCEDGWVEESTPWNGIAMKWEGPNLFGSPGVAGVSTIDFYVDEPGIYEFDWISGFTGSVSTEENDSWVRINADDSYVMDDPLDGTKHYARGCGRGGPYPEGSSGDCYFKVFRTGFGAYWWSARVGDNQAFTLYAKFNQAQTYT
ncbi:MAG: hypothetical protein AAFV01_13695, partial [Bacteroidota bacterium]